VQERTVSLPQAVHFTDSKGQDVVVGPGSYRVEAEGPNRIRLVPAETGESVVIEATSFTHQQAVESPVPVTVPDPQQPDVLHLALLLPGGQGVEAIGTYSGVKSRAVTDPRMMTQLMATTAQFQIMSLVSVTPNHGPSGTPVYVQACGYPPVDHDQNGTLSIGVQQVSQLVMRKWCAFNSVLPANSQNFIQIKGPPGPVTVRLDVPGSSRSAETATFTIDPGPAFVLNPRWKIVFGGAGVLDRETGLVWERVFPSSEESPVEYFASDSCRYRRTGARLGWRLPTASEVGMLFDTPKDQFDATNNPGGLPSGHPFFILKPDALFWVSDRQTRWARGNQAETEETVGYASGLNGNVFERVLDIHLLDPSVTRNRRVTTAPPVTYRTWCVRGPGGVPIQ
jgi:hypothetical protein